MEIMVRNLPDQITEKQIEKFLRPHLAKSDIHTFHCQKLKQNRGLPRGLAKITITDVMNAERFLVLHGQTQPGAQGFATVKQKIFHMKKPVNLSRSTQVPDQFLLKSLINDEEARKHQTKKPPKPKSVRTFNIMRLDCGHWEYIENELVFFSHFHEVRQGKIGFRRGFLVIDLDLPHPTTTRHRVEISYQNIQTFVRGYEASPALTFSLYEAPKFFEKSESSLTPDVLTHLMGELTLQTTQRREIKQKRISAINNTHESVVGSCFCYRVVLQNPTDIRLVAKLRGTRDIPESISCKTTNILKEDYKHQLSRLNNALGGTDLNHVPFKVKFQFQMLAQNGYLPITKVVLLLKQAIKRINDVDEATLIAAVKKLSTQIPFPEPETPSSDSSIETLIKLLDGNLEMVGRESFYQADLIQEHKHLALIHKALVTPAGIYLSGPEPEIRNRVLRKYAEFSDYFLQVSFADEDGEQLQYRRDVSNDDIYDLRFKKVLDGIILIAGRGYEFLGFSHSSLRSQTCWFMAPFIYKEELHWARKVVEKLGDFSMIRSPAKCAARIGQAFSQTFTSITLPQDSIIHIPDIERNGRVFSDGVGTCSESVRERMRKEYTQSRGYNPTVYQIRIAGAKGVVSLDQTLKGEQLCLRPSMVKFQAPDSNIEICGAGLKPLPMYLNRQLIKILEDLGVKRAAFLELQENIIESLQSTTKSPVNAANFLLRNHLGKAARLPWLIRKLLDLNILYDNDDFLRNVLKTVIVVQLRELKYRTRILVENGMTLYGIVDEFDHLKEDEIYCTVNDPEYGSRVLTGSVVVTRAPALHPGDVQCVNAVDVPQDSPLRALQNCVVFSSRGARDLPSQLSGGDLDGDLYNIIYENTLYPPSTAIPASYEIQKPIDIQRTIQTSDMTEFFIDFMKNDQLGRVAILHQIFADMQPQGTLDPKCIQLAKLHSTAVDFSKTGISIDFKKIPPAPRARPDFLAPGPRVLIERDIRFKAKSDEDDDDDDDDIDEDEDISTPRVRYYKSNKVLGALYRAIDEQEIFEQIQKTSNSLTGNHFSRNSPIDEVWKYVQTATALIQYEHHRVFAQDIREGYEQNLADSMRHYSPHPNQHLSEIEVVCGSIVGKSGAPTRRQRESAIGMKDKYERDVAYTVACITRGVDDSHGGEHEALERSIACLAVSFDRPKRWPKVGVLSSFKWLAAAVCLQEVDKFLGV